MELMDWRTGDYACICGLGTQLATIRASRSLTGPARNAVLAIEAARLMGAVIPVETVEELTSQAPDRITNFVISGWTIPTKLAKNPESWRESLAANTSPYLILCVNARGIDGLDTSWLWDVDFEQISARKIIAAGERAADVAYRLHVAGAEVKVATSFDDAVNTAIEWANADGMATGIGAIASYTAFQDAASQHREVGLV
jgi:UDP-N-acetylmuramyl tripeptide synthase